ncbi:flagellar motor switch protein M [Mesobaculum littorinae]|uniref:Flagellar protein FliL n=2 Tax=Mesobaculum littorinae TaxID=2486419 RepID=A0A438AE37_9RHOB|nr:flagellar motor switch protein M [Mesobaculum littorinae]
MTSGPTAAPAGGGGLRRAGMLALVVLLSLAALAGGLAAALGPQAALGLLGLGGGNPAAEAAAGQATDADAAPGDSHAAGHTDGHGAAAGPAPLTLMPFDEIIVNVTDVTATGRRTSRFLKLDAVLVYDETVDGAGHVAARQVYMRDAFQDYLRQLTVRDLQGSAGLYDLKSELLRRARAISGSEAPSEILISDLIIQ